MALVFDNFAKPDTTAYFEWPKVSFQRAETLITNCICLSFYFSLLLSIIIQSVLNEIYKFRILFWPLTLGCYLLINTNIPMYDDL